MKSNSMEADVVRDEQRFLNVESKADTCRPFVQAVGPVEAECPPAGAEVGAEIRLPPRSSVPTRHITAAQDQGSGGRESREVMAPWLALLLMESSHLPFACTPDCCPPAVRTGGLVDASYV